MRNNLIIPLVLFLSACSTTLPVVEKFPDAPSGLLEKCPDLNMLKSGATLSDVALAINSNYALYHECSDKNSEWIDWYNKQKTLFESIK
jgi:hypothetical protein